MLVRFTDGLNEGETAEIDDYVAHAFLDSGKAVRVEDEIAADSEVVETPEKPAARGRRKATQEMETR